MLQPRGVRRERYAVGVADRKSAGSRSDERAAHDLRLLSIVGLWVFGLAVAAMFASQWPGLVGAAGLGALILLASAVTGGGLGFLFAVPRVLSQEAAPLAEVRPAEGASAEAKRSAKTRARLLGTNTNLERISDWLTTMLVGVVLSQLGSIDAGLVRFRLFLEQSARVMPAVEAGGVPTAGMLPTAGPLLLVFGVVAGFMAVYLYTRLVLVALLQGVEEVISTGNQDLDDDKAQVAVVVAAAKLETENAENPGLKGLVTGTTPSVDESLNVMLNTLYQPDRYQDVIGLGNALFSTPAARTPEYWFYLSAAFGQKFTALETSGAGKDELEAAKRAAFDNAKRAVALDPSFRTRLRSISDPAGYDNDLAPFRNDETFMAITGATSGSSAAKQD